MACDDIDECNSNICGNSAVCINTIGSYDCRCKEGYAGNPFIMCSQVQGGVCRDPENCQCKEDLLCPEGYTCQRGQCKNLCDKKKCGPKATCNNGNCICPSGYVGDPSDVRTGCKIQGQCNSDLDCYDSEICFQFSKSIRKCVDACEKIQCGPNALCIANNHRSSCICAPDYKGDPGDLVNGCQPEAKFARECEKDSDCKFGTVCSIDVQGIQKCISPCETVACGTNEECKIDVSGRPTCTCQNEYIWNPVSSACEIPSIPDCTSDENCETVEQCQFDALGVRKCIPVCSHYTCPDNSACAAESHKAECRCIAGYTGNPRDRSGCKPILQNHCTSDAQCSEQETCRTHNQHKILTCLPACDQISCGPNAICVVSNHVPQCQCPPGTYIGDPNDPVAGCKSVPCVYNIDCPPTQLCNRLTHTCRDACDEESCGTNAVCIAENHKTSCQCPAGTVPNPLPDVECIAVDLCNPDPCHTTGICKTTKSGHICECPPGTIGDAYSSGCRPEGNCPSGDKDCPLESVCLSGKCVNPCETFSCGPNAICIVQNRSATCSCPKKYIHVSDNIQDGCLRLISKCSNDSECENGVCFHGECRPLCRNSDDCSVGEKCLNKMCVEQCADHSNCAGERACVNNMCIIGCRSNKNCPSDQSCIDNKCQNPCVKEGSCGPNAICSCQNHQTFCECPEGFEGNPTPQQGCIRTPYVCHQSKDCPSKQICQANQCTLLCQNNFACAVGEICQNGTCAKVCYSNNNCLQGEICSSGVCKPGCFIDQDCRSNQVCSKGQCKCTQGYVETSLGCEDYDECKGQPCHKTAICKNVPGSYTCTCPTGKVGNPSSDPGCSLPDQCQRDSQCADNLTCKKGKCKDPCEAKPCGTKATCGVLKHKVQCSCPPGHLGDAYDKNLGCFEVECVEDTDCSDNHFCDEHTNKCLGKY